MTMINHMSIASIIMILIPIICPITLYSFGKINSRDGSAISICVVFILALIAAVAVLSSQILT